MVLFILCDKYLKTPYKTIKFYSEVVLVVVVGPAKCDHGCAIFVFKVMACVIISQQQIVVGCAGRSSVIRC